MYILGLLSRIGVEGRIMLVRLFWGIFAGVLFWLIDGRVVRLSGGWMESALGWILAVVLYAISIPLVWYLFRGVKKSYIVGKGVTVYFGAWLLTWFTLFDLTIPPIPLGNETVGGGP